MTKKSRKQPGMGERGVVDVSATAAAAVFRSPVGCTGVTAGEHEFLDWCQQQRVRFPSSHLAELPSMGRALVASRAIKMGEVVVEVPDDVVLMADNSTLREVLEEEGMCKPAEDEILEVQGLILAVMYEKWLGDKSNWGPYLALLPDDMTHMPLYWKRKEFQELQGTAAYDKMMGQVQHPADAPTQVPLLWCEVVEPFIAEHPELGLPAGERGYELYRWATSAVASYSFILGDDKYQAMVPVWDLLNHITGQVNVRLHHCAKRHVLQMIATRDIRAEEELVNNYGELSNAELLRGYGFVEERNANNHAQVPLPFLTSASKRVLQEETDGAPANGANGNAARAKSSAAAAPGPGSAPEVDTEAGPDAHLRQRLAARLRMARGLGLLPQHHVFKLFKGRPAPAAMTAVIHLLTTSDAKAAAVRASGRKAATSASVTPGGKGGKGTSQAQQRLQAAAAAAMQAVLSALDGDDIARIQRVYEGVVSRMLGRYNCSLEEDNRLMERYEALAPRLQAAVMARRPEKEALVALREELGKKVAMKRSLTSGVAIGSNKTADNPVAAGISARTGTARGVQGRGGRAGGSSPQRLPDAGFSFGFALS